MAHGDKAVDPLATPAEPSEPLSLLGPLYGTASFLMQRMLNPKTARSRRNQKSVVGW